MAHKSGDLEAVRVWYNQGYARFGEAYMRPEHAYVIFLDLLNVQAPAILLDVACGTGFLLKLARQRGLQTYGVDLSDEAVRVAQRTAPDAEIVRASGEDLPFSNAQFDFITCLGSLEHFTDMNKGLSEMRRVAKPNARFCIMVPNADYLFWKLKKQAGTQQQEVGEELLSLQQWKALFLRNGFDICHIGQDRWFADQMKVFANANPLQIAKRAIKSLVWKLMPLRHTYQFVFILQKSKQSYGK